MDIRKAFLYAQVENETYIEIPEEDKKPEDGDVVGKLLKALYGTREAPQSWQHHISKFLIDLGFQAGVGNPCLYHHAERELQVAVQADDFMIIGEAEKWIQDQIMSSLRRRAR